MAPLVVKWRWEGSMGRKHGFSFSWKRAMGISAAKGRLSRRIGIPLTRSGRQRKFGKWGLRPLFSPVRSRSVSTPMGHGCCPQCGVKFNARASSIGTVKIEMSRLVGTNSFSNEHPQRPASVTARDPGTGRILRRHLHPLPNPVELQPDLCWAFALGYRESFHTCPTANN